MLAGLAWALSLTPLFATPTYAQMRDERAVKAAFVFNLTKYVEWPQASNELVIGFVGEGPMGETLERMLAGRSSESRPIRVVLYPPDEELERCSILYIADSAPSKVRAILDRVRTKSILTVGDTGSFARNGGMVGLVRVGEQVQIQVNLEVTHESRLRISSRLLNIAVIVAPTSGGKD